MGSKEHWDKEGACDISSRVRGDKKALEYMRLQAVLNPHCA